MSAQTRLWELFVGRCSELRTNPDFREVASVSPPKLVFGFGQGGFSDATLPAKAGMTFRATSKVWGYRAGTLLPIKFGPVYFDASGTVLRWWDDHNLPVWPEGVEIISTATAPEGTALVRLGVLGPWRKGATTNLVYEFSGCFIQRVGLQK